MKWCQFQFYCQVFIFLQTLLIINIRPSYNAIQSCRIEQRSHLNNNNIVLSSGSMSFPGMAERMRAELESLSLSAHSPGNFDVSIAPHGRFAAWVGGSIFASTNTFREMGCSKGRYEEVGVRGIY